MNKNNKPKRSFSKSSNNSSRKNYSNNSSRRDARNVSLKSNSGNNSSKARNHKAELSFEKRVTTTSKSSFSLQNSKKIETDKHLDASFKEKRNFNNSLPTNNKLTNRKPTPFLFEKKKADFPKKIDFSSELIRLNKYLADAGICSRREADELIQSGLVSVNGKTITKLGVKVNQKDKVVFDEKHLKPQKKEYILLNKPKGFITSVKDEKNRKTVMDLINTSFSSRIYPIGRLDRQTTGVLLLTNDGEMTKKLTHPSHKIKKIYHVSLDRKLQTVDFEKIENGVFLEEGKLLVDKISYIEGASKNEVGIELHVGWNRVIRRLFKKLNYEVVSLDRVSFGGLTKKKLKRGQWRVLAEEEINFLKMR